MRNALLAGLLLLLPVIAEASSEDTANRVLPSIVEVGISMSGSDDVRTVGSGIVVRDDGYVLTAKHVLMQSSRVFIKTLEGHAYISPYYVADSNRDLALIRVLPREGRKLVAIELGGSPVVGQEVFTFGYPARSSIGGLGATVARGIISGVERSIEEPGGMAEPQKEDTTTQQPSFPYRLINPVDIMTLLGMSKSYTYHMIQIDAMVNPGSSGGALTDSEGRLLGVVNSIITNTGSDIGLNFVVPLSEAISLFESMPPYVRVDTIPVKEN